MKKIIFLEGLPNVGKTTIINHIRKLSLPNIYVVDEIINKDISQNRTNFYLLNDELKINKYNSGTIIVDRGIISTISYEQTKKIINTNYNDEKTIKWFNSVKAFYNDNNVKVIYLKRLKENYVLPYDDVTDPYGSTNNQKLLEAISLYNLKKYVKNYEIKEYEFSKLEEVVYEIIN